MAHWPRRTAMLLAAVLGTAALGISPAEAGGPTSVLLSAPPKVVAAGYEDKAYEELQQLVDTSVVKPEASAEHRGVGKFIRATWLIHDMSVWRLDLIYPDAPGGPWIATTMDTNGSGRMPETPVWHRATDGVRLLKLLDSLGLLARSGENYGGPTELPQAGGHVAETPETAAAAPVDDPPATTLKADQPALSGWRWSIPGALLGAVLTFVAVRLVPRRRPWELIDQE
ncbi:hypothetical protein GCM10009789_20960 [Kribbella sancticallisti]|uniref:Uncharacterized protein n=1 Tax=Kribbella sancticallisti TaxID=460087 RepID=A0ABN2D066_9ACTN